MIKKKETIIAIIFALPFVCIASYLWLNASNFAGGTFEAYWYGDRIYNLGLPLTGIVIYGPSNASSVISSEKDWWLVPIIDILFFLQWIIWAHILSFLNKVRKRGKRDSADNL